MNENFYRSAVQNCIEFKIRSLSVSKMYESLGFSNDIVEFSSEFIKTIDEQIKDTSYSKETTKEYTKGTTGLKSTFFNNFLIKLNLIKQKGLDVPYYEGRFNDSKSKIIFDYNGRVAKIFPVLELSVYAEFDEELKYKTYSAVGHEMAHAHSEFNMISNTLNKLIENNDTSVKDFIKKRNNGGISVDLIISYIDDKTNRDYFNNVLVYKNNYTPPTFHDVSRLYYLISEPEKRAIIQELRHDLEEVKYDIQDSKSATDAIFNSSVYKENVKAADEIYKNIYMISLGKDDEKKDFLLKAINRCFGKKYKDIYGAVAGCGIKLEKFKKFFFDRSTKVVQDIVDRNVSRNFY